MANGRTIDVVLATLLFILMSPGLIITVPYGEKKGIASEETSNLAVIVHGVLFYALNTAVAENTWGIFGYLTKISDALEGVARRVPTVMAALGFIILSPGLLLTIPSFDGETFFSEETNTLAILVHSALFYAAMRAYSDNQDNNVVKWINDNVANGL